MTHPYPCLACGWPVRLTDEEREALATGNTRLLFCAICVARFSPMARERMVEAAMDPPVAGGHA
jgi:hypothetical protein